MICAPCKLIFGNYVEALERGADTLVMLGGWGFCRLGYAIRGQQEKLRELGFQFEAVTFNLLDAQADLVRVTQFVTKKSVSRALGAVRLLIDAMRSVDSIERKALATRPRERHKGDTDRVLEEALLRVRECRTHLNSKTPVRIAGRCTVFAESDMIHKQQMGHQVEDILYGLCQALARNFLNNLYLGKELCPPNYFSRGVASNGDMVRAFEELLGTQVTVPPHHDVIGALGVALLARERYQASHRASAFKGWVVSEMCYETTSFECKGCSNLCEVVCVAQDGEIIGRWGSRCSKWDV